MAGAGGWIARAAARAGLPRGTVALVTVRFLLYLGVQASYFIGIIGALAYQTDATTVDLACAVGLFNLFIVAGNAAGGSLLDVRGPRVHTAVALCVAFASCVAFQFVEMGVGAVLVMGAAFGFATGVGFAYLSSYPAYLSADADELKRVNALLSVVSNGAVVLGPAVGGVIAAALPVQRVFLFSAVCAVAAAFPAARLLVHASARRGRAGATGEDATTEPRGSFAESARTVLVHPRLPFCSGWACWRMRATARLIRSSRSTTAMCSPSTSPGWGGCRALRVRAAWRVPRSRCVCRAVW